MGGVQNLLREFVDSLAPSAREVLANEIGEILARDGINMFVDLTALRFRH
jgi:hypothetical protein